MPRHSRTMVSQKHLMYDIVSFSVRNSTIYASHQRNACTILLSAIANSSCTGGLSDIQKA